MPSGRPHPPPRRKRAPASPAEAPLWRRRLGAFRPTQKRPSPAAPPQDPSLSPAGGRIRRRAESARPPARNSATLAAALRFQANTKTPDPGGGSCVCVSSPASGSVWRAWSSVCRLACCLSVVLTQTHHNTLSLAVRFWRCPKSRHSGVRAACSHRLRPKPQPCFTLADRSILACCATGKEWSGLGNRGLSTQSASKFLFEAVCGKWSGLGYDSKTLQLIPS